MSASSIEGSSAMRTSWSLTGLSRGVTAPLELRDILRLREPVVAVDLDFLAPLCTVEARQRCYW